ncbi:MAG TPA: FecR family protein [Stellaceae bacterium]|nr:FecR family protein [Stellaceae bacterium]
MIAIDGSSLEGALSRWAAAALFAVLVLAPPPAGAAQERIGVDTAVNPNASAALPGSGLRRMVLGEDVVYNERIVTTEKGQTQVLFVDQSAMSVGPNSNLLIDRFVYDPNTKTGQLAASLTRGVFRFVGGELSKHGNQVTLKTPAATIGIRGGVFLARQDCTSERGKCDGKLSVVFVYGIGLTVTGDNGVSQTITRPGFEVVVPGSGLSPSSPFPASLGLTGRLLVALDGHPGAHGGAQTIPTDNDVANSGVSGNISGNVAASINAAASNTPPPPKPPNTDVGNLQNQFNVNTVQGQSQTQNQSPPPPPPETVSGGFARTHGNATTAGYRQPQTPYSGGTLTDGVFTVAIGSGMVQIPLAAGFQSFGPAGTESPLGRVTGTSFLALDGSFFYADLTPVGQPSEREFIYGGQPVNAGFYAPTGAPRFFAFNLAPDGALQSVIPFLRQQTGGLLADPVVSPLFISAPANASFAGPIFDTGAPFARSLQASLAINGQGAGQSSVIVLFVGNPLATSPQPSLQGQIAGSFLASGTSLPVGISSFASTPQDGNGVSFYGGSALSGFVLAGTAGEQTAGSGPITSYNFEEPANAVSLPAGVGASQTSQTLSGFFGGIMTRESGSPLSYAVTGTSSITTDATNLRVGATFAGADPFTGESSGVRSLALQFGGLTGGTALGQAYIDDNLFAALQNPSVASQVNGNDANGSSIWMLTSDVVPSAALLPNGVSFCQCQFLKWGYWGGALSSPEGETTRIDAAHINTWVAGSQPTSVGDIATLQGSNVTGTYTGALVGTVNNNGAQYLAAGGLNATYHFATQTGNFQVVNFDGHSFAAAIPAGNLSGSSYSFGFNTGAFAGNVNGGFFGPLAAETGGNFAFHALAGSPYLAAGIYTAKR